MPDTSNTLALLTHVDIFQGIAAPVLAELLAAADSRDLEAGDVLFHEGEAGGSMYLVASGAIELTQHVKPNQAQRLALLDRGQILGELSLFDDLPRSATAQAFVKTTVLAFPKAAVDRLLETHSAFAPQLLRNLVKKLSLRLRDADEEIRGLSRSAAH